MLTIALPTWAEQLAQIEAIAADPNAYVAETRRLSTRRRWCTSCGTHHLYGAHLPGCTWASRIWYRAQIEGR